MGYGEKRTVVQLYLEGHKKGIESLRDPTVIVLTGLLISIIVVLLQNCLTCRHKSENGLTGKVMVKQ